MEILIESMTKLSYKGYDIRCWRQEQYYNEEILRITRIEIIKKIESIIWFNGQELAMKLIEIERMNAVEVLLNGQGLVLYKNWP